MLDCVVDSGLTQIVHSPTKENILLTNHPSLISDCHTLPGISDHEIVFINSYCTSQLKFKDQCKEKLCF